MNFCPSGYGWVVVHRGVGGLLSTGSWGISYCPQGCGWVVVYRIVGDKLLSTGV